MKIEFSDMANRLFQGIKNLVDKENIASESHNQQLLQRQLLLHYQQLHKLKLKLPRWEDTGFRVYSQNDEDGLLLYLFSLLGTTNKVCVDIAFGSPFGANTTNLICNWGWTGLLIEGNETAVKMSRRFFDSNKDTKLYPPKLVRAQVTAENVNGLLEHYDVTGEIDLFSLDVDGIDWWIWKNLHVIQPRVVIVEYQDIWGPEKSVTVPYKPDFNRFDIHPHYCSASLPAFVKLGKEKGYRLIGCNKYGFNAFFIRSGVGEDVFAEISPHQCFDHPIYKYGAKTVLPQVKNYEWVKV
jgi:hypothetical protein